MKNYEYKVYLRGDGSVKAELFYMNGDLHREGDLPAIIKYRPDGTVKKEEFFKKDRRHRDGDQPAVIQYRTDGSLESEQFYHHGTMRRKGDESAFVQHRVSEKMESSDFAEAINNAIDRIEALEAKLKSVEKSADYSFNANTYFNNERR